MLLRHENDSAGQLVDTCLAAASSIDTTTAGGRLIFHVFGVLAEFKRELIRERSRAGVSRSAIYRALRRADTAVTPGDGNTSAPQRQR